MNGIWRWWRSKRNDKEKTINRYVFVGLDDDFRFHFSFCYSKLSNARTNAVDSLRCRSVAEFVSTISVSFTFAFFIWCSSITIIRRNNNFGRTKERENCLDDDFALIRNQHDIQWQQSKVEWSDSTTIVSWHHLTSSVRRREQIEIIISALTNRSLGLLVEWISKRHSIVVASSRFAWRDKKRVWE